MIGQVIPETPWERARLGRFTSSQVYRLLVCGKREMTEQELAARPKKGKGSATTHVDDYSVLSDGALTYVREKAAEIRTKTVRQMENHSTVWGKQHEPNAMEALKKLYPGLIYYGTTDQRFFKYTLFSGGSPDAVCQNIVFEVKCPENPAVHEEYMDILSQEDLKKYKDHYSQLQMNMAAVAKDEDLPFESMLGVFASFDPRYPEELQLHPVLIQPDVELKDQIDKALEAAELALADRIARKPLLTA